MSIVLQSSGGGSVTLQEPVTASNLTITVPAVSGTMLTTASTGTVLQVVNAVKSDLFTTTSSSYVDVTGYAASITPTSSSSKILILVNCALSGSSTSEAVIAVYRGATLVTNTGITRVASVDYSANITYLDSPATTSSTTYQIKTKANVSTSTINQNSDQDSFITLMEIAG